MPNRIREWRKRLGLSLQQAGPLVGTTFGQLGKLETGERELTKLWMERIARAFGEFSGLPVTQADLLNPADGGLTDRERRLIETYREVPESLRAGYDAMAEAQQPFRGFGEVVPIGDKDARKTG